MYEYRRIIIENRTNIPDHNVLSYIEQVIKLGRISTNNRQYCHIAKFRNSNIVVWTDLNKQSDRFVIEYNKE